ncbi:organic cation transporter protein-like [Pectinophora gossypiella]|uniref:organic cation transporter protein-like n=1 Tax=Pectinophora gossypiella TaxID=13191 RepID=UPI00214E8426|nr:organic cation transporter protein-like [Pectinophora gossypiella]
METDKMETQADDSEEILDEEAISARHDTQPHPDVTAIVVGDFGWWQLKISTLMSLLKLSNCWYQLNIIFMAPQQEFWCQKPPSMARYTETEWRSMCAPRIEEFPCLIFDPDILSIAPDMDRSMIPLVPCHKFVYDKSIFERTMTSDWNLVCEKHWLIHITQCTMMCGVLLGGVFFGMLADKYGRKNPLLICIILQALASFIASALPWYWLFLINWFVLALASGGITIISFVLCMEAVSGKWRMIVPVLYQLPFGLGNTVMAVLAYWLRDWRKLEFSLACLSSLYAFYWFCTPESPRWLLANGQIDKAMEVLYVAARENGRKWTKEQIRGLIPIRIAPEKRKIPAFVDFLRHKNMRLKTILLSLNWLFTGIAFYTFCQYLGGIGGNMFVTVAITGIISTPGPILCVFVITRTGRRNTVWTFQVLTAVCFVALLVIPREEYPNDWPRLLFAGIGFAAMAASVPTLYLYSGELYPTLGRNRGVGWVTIFARLGSMIAPFIVSLDSINQNLPLMLLAVTSFGQIVLLLPLPETKDTPLPDTIEEAERFTKETAASCRKKDVKPPVPWSK